MQSSVKTAYAKQKTRRKRGKGDVYSKEKRQGKVERGERRKGDITKRDKGR